MTGFLTFGLVLTILVLAGGAFLWWRTDRPTQAGSGKLRHREEARRFQKRLDGDADFARNFHRPIQNEILETVQALDHLTSGWDQDGDAVTYERFKNELAESFPALRRDQCAYPQPIADDVARRFGKAKLSPGALESRLQAHAEEQARLRATFHAARANANARHQMSTTGPAVGPVTLAPGSLPFHVPAEKRVRRPAWVAPGIVVAALAVAGAATYLYLNPQLLPTRRTRPADEPVKAEVNVQAPHPTLNPPVPTPSIAFTNPDALAAMDAIPPGSSPDATVQIAPAVQPPETTLQAGTASSEQAALPTPALVASVSLAQRVAQSQARAIDKHPELAVPDSEINLRFVFRYKNLVEDHSPRLQDPDWPEKLAEECATSIAGSKGRRPMPFAPKHR